MDTENIHLNRHRFQVCLHCGPSHHFYSCLERVKTHFKWPFNECLLSTRQWTWNPKAWLSYLGDLCLWLWQVTSLNLFLHLWNSGGQYVRIKMLANSKLPFIHQVVALLHKKYINCTSCSQRVPDIVKIMTTKYGMWSCQTINTEETLCLEQPQCHGALRMAGPPGRANKVCWWTKYLVWEEKNIKNHSRVYAWAMRSIELPLTGVDWKGEVCSELYYENG